MSINSFLALHDASAAPTPEPTRAESVLSEIAEHAVRSADAEKLLRTIDFALRHKRNSVRIRLDDEGAQPNAAVAIARRLTNIGLLSHANQIENQNALSARIARNCSDEIRDSVLSLMQNGSWLELGTARLLDNLARDADLDIEIAAQVQVSLPDGSVREIDVLAVAGDEALVVECKAGPRGTHDLGRFSGVATRLGIPESRALLIAPNLEQDTAADLMAFHPVTALDRQGIIDHLSQILGAWKEGSAAPDSAELAAAESNQSQAQQVQITRRRVDPPEIEAALIEAINGTTAPVPLKELVPAVRDLLDCARRPVNDAARTILARKQLLDTNGTPIVDFYTPVAAVASRPTAQQFVERDATPVARSCQRQEASGFLRRMIGRR